MRRIAIKRRVKNIAYYLMAGLIPFILAVAAYVRIADIMYDEALAADISQLQHKQEIMDGFLLNVQSIGYALSNDATIQSISSLDHVSGTDISMLRETVTGMTIGNAIFDPVQRQVLCGYYIFFPDSQVIFNIRDRSAFLTETWKTDYDVDGLPAQQWYDLVFRNRGSAGFIPRIALNINGADREVALYLQPIPVGAVNPRAMAVIAIDMNRFAELLIQPGLGDETAVCLIDSGGDYLYASEAAENRDDLILLSTQMTSGESRRVTMDGQDAVVMTVRSSATNWTLLRVLSHTAIAPASGKLQLFISLSSLAIILFVILTTIVAAYLNNKPLREISRMLFALKKHSEPDVEPGIIPSPSREMDDVSYGVQQLIRQNRSIQVDLEKYRDKLGDVMLDRILEGKIQREAEIKECTRLLGGLFSHQAYVVMIVQISSGKPYAVGMDIKDIYMQRMAVLRHLIPRGEIVHAVNTTDEIALISLIDSVPVHKNDLGERLRDRAGDILTQLENAGHTNLRIGIGRVCERLIDINRSVEQARTALFMAKQGERIILFDRENHESADTYYYPLEEERRLINTVRSGNQAEAWCILESIFKENYIKRKLNRSILDQLGQELQGTLIKLSGSIPPDSSPQERENGVSVQYDHFPDLIFDRQCGEIIGLCACFSESKHTSLETLVQQIVEYLETVYMDENVSLNSIAERFNFSEAYLSRIFKEQSGENFTACLERIRLYHAQRMLTQTRIPIHEIVHRVGYAYYDTFRKAFKRFYGVSPGEYRNLASGQPEKAI